MRLALAMALGVLLSAAPAEASQRIGRCKLADSATVEAKGGRLLAWSVRHRDRDDDFFRNHFVCRRGSGTRIPLTTTLELLDYVEHARHVTVAGDFVAYVRSSPAWSEGSGAELVVFDAYRRSERRRVIGFDVSSGAYTLPEVVPALVLARTGSAALVVHHPSDRDRSGRPREPVGLRVFDPRGTRLLDRGGGIDPASLRLDGYTVHWTSAGVPRSASLVPPT
jgi:hypothetical protein